MQRGDEIVAIDSGSGYVAVSQLLAGGSTITDALGPAEAGVRRGLRLLRNGVTRDVSLVKRTVTIDPVPDGFGTQVLPLAGTPGVGYLNLRSYISTADAQLGTAFAQLPRAWRARLHRRPALQRRRAGEHLRGDEQPARRRAQHGRRAVPHRLQRAQDGAEHDPEFPPDRAVGATGAHRVPDHRVRRLRRARSTSTRWRRGSKWRWSARTRSASRSASTRSTSSDCEDRLRLVAFKTVNALGQGDYYDGLAGTLPFACAATDTLDQPLGSTSEGMVAAALGWLRRAPARAVMPAGRTRQDGGGEFGERYPRPAHPSAAQWWLPGIE